jgi:hypothetical protein
MWSPILSRALRRRGLRRNPKGLGDDAEIANFFEERLDLGAVGGRSGTREPELVKGVRRVLGILRAEGFGGAGGIVGASREGLISGEEELSGAVARVTLERLVEQLDGCLGVPEQQLSKAAEEKPDAVARSVGSSAMARSIADRVSLARPKRAAL